VVEPGSKSMLVRRFLAVLKSRMVSFVFKCSVINCTESLLLMKTGVRKLHNHYKCCKYNTSRLTAGLGLRRQNNSRIHLLRLDCAYKHWLQRRNRQCKSLSLVLVYVGVGESNI
jgi:hypothetical protein